MISPVPEGYCVLGYHNSLGEQNILRGEYSFRAPSMNQRLVMSVELQSHLMMASVDFARLQAFVRNLRIKMNADAALFRYLDYNDWTYPITLDCGSGIFNPTFFQDYDGGWGMNDPHIRVGVNRKLPDSTVYICSEHYPPEDRVDDPYFRDFLPKHNIEWFAGYLAQVDNEYGAGFAVVRSPGKEPFTAQDRLFLQPLVNILEDCVRMMLNGQRTKLIQKAMTMALETNALHGFCIDAQARVLWVSAEAETLLAGSQDLQIKAGRLVSRSTRGDALLERIKKMAGLTQNGEVPHESEIAIPQEDGPPVTLTMKATRAESGQLGKAGLGACVLLGSAMLVHQKKRELSGTLSVLTKTELEIAEHIAMGMTAPQIAESLKVKPSTVRTHMKHSYRKLGINSKTELAALYINSKKTP